MLGLCGVSVKLVWDKGGLVGVMWICAVRGSYRVSDDYVGNVGG